MERGAAARLPVVLHSGPQRARHGTHVGQRGRRQQHLAQHLRCGGQRQAGGSEAPLGARTGAAVLCCAVRRDDVNVLPAC